MTSTVYEMDNCVADILSSDWPILTKLRCKLQRGCYTQATCLAMLRKVEGRLLFLQLATQQLQLQNGVLHVDFFLQLARQQENLLRVTWP